MTVRFSVDRTRLLADPSDAKSPFTHSISANSPEFLTFALLKQLPVDLVSDPMSVLNELASRSEHHVTGDAKSIDLTLTLPSVPTGWRTVDADTSRRRFVIGAVATAGLAALILSTAPHIKAFREQASRVNAIDTLRKRLGTDFEARYTNERHTDAFTSFKTSYLATSHTLYDPTMHLCGTIVETLLNVQDLIVRAQLPDVGCHAMRDQSTDELEAYGAELAVNALDTQTHVDNCFMMTVHDENHRVHLPEQPEPPETPVAWYYAMYRGRVAGAAIIYQRRRVVEVIAGDVHPLKPLLAALKARYAGFTVERIGEKRFAHDRDGALLGHQMDQTPIWVTEMLQRRMRSDPDADPNVVLGQKTHISSEFLKYIKPPTLCARLRKLLRIDTAARDHTVPLSAMTRNRIGGAAYELYTKPNPVLHTSPIFTVARGALDAMLFMTYISSSDEVREILGGL
jgi:hypothetical protein